MSEYTISEATYCFCDTFKKDRFRIPLTDPSYKDLLAVSKILETRYEWSPLKQNFFNGTESLEMDVSHATRLIKLGNQEKGNTYAMKVYFEKHNTVKNPEKTYVKIIPAFIKLVNKFEIRKGEKLTF